MQKYGHLPQPLSLKLKLMKSPWTGRNTSLLTVMDLWNAAQLPGVGGHEVASLFSNLASTSTSTMADSLTQVILLLVSDSSVTNSSRFIIAVK